MIELHDRNVCTGMDALHTRHHTVGTQVAHSRAGTRQALIVGIIFVASVAAWARVEPVAQPVRAHVRRR